MFASLNWLRVGSKHDDISAWCLMLVTPAPKICESLADRQTGCKLPDLQVSVVCWLSPLGHLQLNHSCLLVSGASKAASACVSSPETDFMGLGCGLGVGGRSPGDSSVQTRVGITVPCSFLCWLLFRGRWWKRKKNPGLGLGCLPFTLIVNKFT